MHSSGPTPVVLVIDDNRSIATALDVLLSLHDIAVVHAATPDEGLATLDRMPVDCVIQDMNFAADTTSGLEGIALFHRIRERHPRMPVILLTAWTSLETAVDLVKAGAADYVAKPWDDQRLIVSVKNLIELGQATRALSQRLQVESDAIRELQSRYDLRGLVFRDAATERVVSVACQVARSELPVLITGPNGAGKERIAEIIQANSAVRDGPFITLNCGAMPSELIEAELFGAEAGAYTGAAQARQGKFEAADGGTLFLDEIGNLPLAGQVKLLRVLETGRFQRLGSNRERQVRVRVISATNADLPSMINAGTFRQDLFYRLNVIEIALPPLADRPEDIVPLATHFLEKGKSLDPSARAALLRHSWPGNVRELKNVIQRASLLGEGPAIRAVDLGLTVTGSTGSVGAMGAMGATGAMGAAASIGSGVPMAPVAGTGSGVPSGAADREPDRESIELALTRAGGVVAQAASQLGLSRQALYRRMERLGIARDRPPDR